MRVRHRASRPMVVRTRRRDHRVWGTCRRALREAGFPTQEGTLHPLLNRLRREGLVVHEWRESPTGPPRKYLELSDTGRAQLGEFRTYLHSLTALRESIGR